MGTARQQLGRRGEDLAAAAYRARGYAVLERNWRCRAGELDLVCAKGCTIVFCEVKARRGAEHGHPLEAVTAEKQRRLRRLAAIYLAGQRTYWQEIRFDVATLLGGRVEVLEHAF